jgi:hypothetical protein
MTPEGPGRASSRKDEDGDEDEESSAARPRSISPRVKATRRLWASTTSSRVDWARRGSEGVKPEDGVVEDVDGEVGEWKVAPLRRDMLVLRRVDVVAVRRGEGVTTGEGERRGWRVDMIINNEDWLAGYLEATGIS